MAKKANISKTNNSLNKTRWFVVIIAVVVLFFIATTLIVEKSVTGNAIKSTCRDSDYVFNYYTFGSVKLCSWGIFCTNYPDKCLSSTQLKEFSCSGSSLVSQTHNCPGYCQSGKCVNVLKTCKGTNKNCAKYTTQYTCIHDSGKCDVDYLRSPVYIHPTEKAKCTQKTWDTLCRQTLYNSYDYTITTPLFGIPTPCAWTSYGCTWS
ncbi:MAG TPA: hypothetical protein P5277_03755 [Candidatus Paceibacterota bacterium]|nr:hypothetical protein [Candidatus Paceibacterota bacterium]